MRLRFILLLAASLVANTFLQAENVPFPLGHASKEVRNREKIVVQGRVEKKIDLDHFVLADASGQLILTMQGVRHNLQKGDDVTVYARFIRSPANFPRYDGELEALDFAMSTEKEKAAQLVEKFGRPFSSKPSEEEPEVPSPAPPGPVEDRLRKLDDLKKQGLISDDEHRRHRDRILESL